MSGNGVWGVTRAQREQSGELAAPDATPRKTRAPKKAQAVSRTRRIKSAPEQLRQKARERHLRSTYGMTPDEYARLLAEQQGVCAICHRPQQGLGGRNGNTPRMLAVDHDHKSGKVRGLLCGDCNTAIGLLEHDPTLLARAIVYLTENEHASEWKLAQ